MPHRNDRDALLARAEALERRAGELAAERDQAVRRADELARRVEPLERELARLRQDRGTSLPPRRRLPMRALLLGVTALTIPVVVILVLALR